MNIPTKKAVGSLLIFLKSLIFKPIPRLNIIKIRESGRSISIIILVL
jgi:hypothetical protein